MVQIRANDLCDLSCICDVAKAFGFKLLLMRAADTHDHAATRVRRRRHEQTANVTSIVRHQMMQMRENDLCDLYIEN